MEQISFFSAEACRPRLADLAGVLCGHGRIAGFGRTAARLSVVLDEPWRARAMAAEFRCRGTDVEVARNGNDELVVRTPFRVDLLPMAELWRGDDGKALPAGFRLDGAKLRLWALVGGHPLEHGYLLRVDEQAPGTHAPLSDALAGLGVPNQLVTSPGGVPAMKVIGRRRLDTLAELVGAPPASAEPAWPRVDRPVRRAG